MKYIDAEKLIAEIERLKERAQAERVLHPQTILSAKNYLLIQDYNSLLKFITSLQQEQSEVELSADIEMEWDSFNKHVAEYDEGSEDVVWLNWNSFVDIATHYYNLGLKARKEE